MIYEKDQPVQAGASGAGCSATVTLWSFTQSNEEGYL